VSRMPLDPHSSRPAELRARIEAERRGEPFLLYRDGEGRQVLLELNPERERVTIGRRASSDVALRWDPEVSRLHAELERIGTDWIVRDDGLSHNGTFVNNERLQGRRRLRGGDILALGKTTVAFCVPVHTSPSATRTSLHGVAIDVSPAQLRVLHALCRPLTEQRYAAPASNREIAEELVISVETVKSTLGRLFELFGCGHLRATASSPVMVAHTHTRRHRPVRRRAGGVRRRPRAGRSAGRSAATSPRCIRPPRPRAVQGRSR
jgi:pSer/pThr/pTyr-binding forkhead associated (FHA) protein